jgi:hypothetical protein
MDEHEGKAGGEALREPAPHEPRLDPRAAEALDAVRAGGDEEDAARVGRAEAGRVEEERLTVRPGERVAVRDDLAAGW